MKINSKIKAGARNGCNPPVVVVDPPLPRNPEFPVFEP